MSNIYSTRREFCPAYLGIIFERFFRFEDIIIVAELLLVDGKEEGFCILVFDKILVASTGLRA